MYIRVANVVAHHEKLITEWKYIEISKLDANIFWFQLFSAQTRLFLNQKLKKKIWVFCPLNLCYWSQFWHQTYWYNINVNSKNTNFYKLLSTISSSKQLLSKKCWRQIYSFICICYLHCLRGFLRCTTTLDTLMYIHADATIFLHLRQESRIWKMRI